MLIVQDQIKFKIAGVNDIFYRSRFYRFETSKNEFVRF